MTHKDKGHFRQKHPSNQERNPLVAEAVEGRALEGEISCAVAFTIAEDLKVPPAEVGRTIDLMEMKIVKCQMGLYGYKPKRRIVEPAEEVSPKLEEEIRQALVNERLPCEAAWKIAKRLGHTRMAVSSACEALEIKISPCQLGSF